MAGEVPVAYCEVCNNYTYKNVDSDGQEKCSVCGMVHVKGIGL